ncbi:hypothetical protein Agub_g113 [Astrephomene gubernaculifera]|uniref:Uncharacterized protein n=1 Tax=Astrephomene gubernaculifera TaxID=47775 RepID=A0AAD3DF88_9CHLO|nr:hypothetical protein Agub_g113 [Astrephomene gubernaculifera]
MAYTSHRTLATGYEVSLEWSRVQPNVFPEDDEDWIEVLRRPPQTWSAAEVAHWAQRPHEHGGGQLGDLVARRLWENAIDGHLLLVYGSHGGSSSTVSELSRVLGLSEPAHRQALAEAVAELKTLPERILYGEVVLPPPAELLEQQQMKPATAAATRAASCVGSTTTATRCASRLGRRQEHDRWMGVWGGGSGRGTDGDAKRSAGRPVGLSEKERVLHDAKVAAAASKALAKTTAPPGTNTGFTAGAVTIVVRQHGRTLTATATAAAVSAAGAGLEDGAAGVMSDVDAGSRVDQRRQRQQPAGDATTAFDGDSEECQYGSAEGGAAADGGGGEEGLPGDGTAWGGGGVPRVMREMRRMGELVSAHEDVVRRLKVLREEGPAGLDRLMRERQRAATAATAAASAAGGAAPAAAGQAAGSAAAGAGGVEDPGGLADVEQRGRALRQGLAAQGGAVDDLARQVPLRSAMRRAAEAAVEAAGGGDEDCGGEGSGGEGFLGVGPTREPRGGWRQAGEEGEDGGRVRQSLSAAGRAVLAEADRREKMQEEQEPWVYDSDDEDDDHGAGDTADVAGRRAVDGFGGGKSSAPAGRKDPWVRGDDGAGVKPSVRRHVVRPLPGLPAGRGLQPGSHEVHPPRPGPDPWRTADQKAVRRVLAQGAATPVHHTLKSKLAQDAVRHMYGIAPPETSTAYGTAATRGVVGDSGAGAAGGAAAGAAAGQPFYPPTSLLTNHRAAAHEVQLRRQQGLPVSPDLLAARSLAAPRTARLVVRAVAGKPEQAADSVMVQPEVAADGSFSFPSRYGFQVAPSPNTKPAAWPNPPQPHHADSATTATTTTTPPPPRPQSAKLPFPASNRPYQPSRLARPASASPSLLLPTTQPIHPGGFVVGPSCDEHHQQQQQDHHQHQSLAPPEARVRGIGADGALHRAIAAKAATVAAGEAATAAAAAADAGGTAGCTEAVSSGRARTRTGGGHAGGGTGTTAGAVVRGAMAPEALAAPGAAPADARCTVASRLRGTGRIRTYLEGEWGDSELQQSVREVLHMLDGGCGPPATSGLLQDGSNGSGGCGGGPVRAALSPPSSGRRTSQRQATETVQQPRIENLQKHSRRGGGRQQGGAVQLYRFREGQLVYTGRRPPFDSQPDVPYELPGWHPRPMGQTWTKTDAERLAAGVAAEARPGTSELHWAAGRGDVLRLRELLEEAGDPDQQRSLVNSRNPAWETPLHRAAMCPGPSAVGAMRLLLAAGAETDPRDVNGITPLMGIITAGCWQPEGPLRARTLLAAGARVDVCDCCGETLLHKAFIHHVCAASSGLQDLLAMLLPLARQHLPPYTHEDNDNTNLHATASGSTAPPATGAFSRAHPLASAAAAATSGAFVATAVAAAAAAAASTLDRHSPPPPSASSPSSPPAATGPLHIDARDAEGRTALHLACCRPHAHGRSTAATAPIWEGGEYGSGDCGGGGGCCCVSALLAAGADPNAVDGGGRRALHLVLSEAAAASRLREANRINHCKLATSRHKQPPGALCWLVERLLRAGADPSTPEPSRGQTPLHLAATARSRPLLRLLLRFGADPRVADQAGRTPADALERALRSTRDREEAAHLTALLDLLREYTNPSKQPKTKATTSTGRRKAPGQRTLLSDAGSSSSQRRQRQGADKPGLGGGAGPKSLRQLYRERFGESSESNDDEDCEDASGGEEEEKKKEEKSIQPHAPSHQQQQQQHTLALAYMVADRASRLGAAFGCTPAATTVTAPSPSPPPNPPSSLVVTFKGGTTTTTAATGTAGVTFNDTKADATTMTAAAAAAEGPALLVTQASQPIPVVAATGAGTSNPAPASVPKAPASATTNPAVPSRPAARKGLTPDQAATRIQAVYRGHRTRQRMRGGPSASSSRAAAGREVERPVQAAAQPSTSGVQAGDAGSVSQIQAAVAATATAPPPSLPVEEDTGRAAEPSTPPISAQTLAANNPDQAPAATAAAPLVAATQPAAPHDTPAVAAAAALTAAPPLPKVMAAAPRLGEQSHAQQSHAKQSYGQQSYGSGHQRAATCIQAAWRGRQARRTVERARQEAAEAVKQPSSSKTDPVVGIPMPAVAGKGDSHVNAAAAAAGNDDEGARAAAEEKEEADIDDDDDDGLLEISRTAVVRGFKEKPGRTNSSLRGGSAGGRGGGERRQESGGIAAPSSADGAAGQSGVVAANMALSSGAAATAAASTAARAATGSPQRVPRYEDAEAHAGSDEDGGSDKVAQSFGGWSAASTAVSGGLESLSAAIPLEGPPLPPSRRPSAATTARGAAAVAFSFAGTASTGEGRGGGGGGGSINRALGRTTSSMRRAGGILPQVAVDESGRIVGDVGDLDLLDLDSEGEGDEGGGGGGVYESGDDGSLPSGFVVAQEEERDGGGGGGFHVVHHSEGGGGYDADDDGDSVF